MLTLDYLLCRYNYFFRELTPRINSIVLTGGSLVAIYQLLFAEAQR